MDDGGPTDSSPATAVDPADPRGSQAFSLLGNETRLAILLTLWDEFDPFAEGTWDPTEGNMVTFSELRDRIGMRDSGQFNYHLSKLEGSFVEQTDDGYRLLPAGNEVVRTVVSIAGFEDISLEPTEIDIPCSLCDAPTAITYQHQRLYHICTECDGRVALGDKHPSGVLGAWIGLKPASLSQRESETTYSTTRTEVYYLMAMRSAGICPWCSGAVESTLHICESHDPRGKHCPLCGRNSEFVSRFVCTVCKHTSQVPVPLMSLHHPAVVAFYWEHGIELGSTDRDTVALYSNLGEDTEEELVSRDPPRVRVTFVRKNDTIQVTYDGTLTVVDVTEPD